MQKLVLNIFLLSSFVLGTIGLTWYFNPYKAEDLETAYSAAVIDKFHRLDSLKSPKIVLMAGSNFAYGINSELIEKAMGMPVVNMALHYNLGTDFMLRSLEDKLNKGDIVILGFEYIIESEGNTQEKLWVRNFYPSAKHWIKYRNFLDEWAENGLFYVLQFRSIVRRLINNEHFHPTVSDTYNIFFRKGFNQYGDLVSHLNNPPVAHLPESMLFNLMSLEKPIVDMNVFTEKMQKKGVEVYYIFPTYAETAFKKDKSTIDRLEKDLNVSPKYTILGHPSDQVFPDSLYQDMIYHLNWRGRDIRTQKLIDLLQQQKNNSRH